MSTSWQYNTSATMSNYGSVTVVPHSPLVPSNTSNSQYGAWFGPGQTLPGSMPRTSTASSSGGGSMPPPRTPLRVLGNVPSANDKYSSMKTNSVSAMIGHPVPDPKEKFSSLANKFGNGRILTPITSQYDLIMQEEEESKPVRRESKTPIHSPDVSEALGHVTAVDITKVSPRDNGYRKMTYKDDALPPHRDQALDNANDSNSSFIAKRPGFERSQTLLSTSSSHQSQPEQAKATTPSYLQRSNTFTSNDPSSIRYSVNNDVTTSRFSNSTSGDVSSSRFSNGMSQYKSPYPWKHEPHPPPVSTSSTTTQGSNGATTLSLSDVQRAGADLPSDSAGSQRSVLSADSSSGGSSLSYLDSSPVTNGMYWLYGSRGRPTPTPFRPNTYMYKMDGTDGSRPIPPPGTSSMHGVPTTWPDSSARDTSPCGSPRGGRLSSLARSNSDMESQFRSPDYKDFSPSAMQESNALKGISYDTRLNLGKTGKKSILKKTSSYDHSRGCEFPLYSEMSSVPRFGGASDAQSPLPPVSRGSPGSPIKVGSSGKKVTFKLTPRMKEISPREERPRDYLSMFSSFRFDPSLSEHSDI